MGRRELRHDRMDFTSDASVGEIEVWSDEAEKGPSRVTLYITENKRDSLPVAFDISPTDARMLSAMLIRAAERIEKINVAGTR